MKNLLTGLVAVLVLLVAVKPVCPPATPDRPDVPKLITQLDHKDQWKRKAAARELGEMGPEAAIAVPALIRTLKSRLPLTKPYTGGAATDWDRAPEEAREALIWIGPAAVPALTQALEAGDALTRVNAAWALWAITKETNNSLPVLLKAWRDRDLGSVDDCIRIDATAALGEMARANPDLLFPIILKALSDEPEMGDEVARVLTAMGEKDNRAVVELFELMSSDGDRLYRSAASGLRELKGRSVPLLVRGLASDNAELRSRCAWALGGMTRADAAPAIPSLKACLKDSNKDVREWATFALDCIDKKAFGPPEPGPDTITISDEPRRAPR